MIAPPDTTIASLTKIGNLDTVMDARKLVMHPFRNIVLVCISFAT